MTKKVGGSMSKKVGGSMTKKEIQQALAELERVGLVRKTGTFRPGKNGMPRPVYEAVPEDEQDEAAKAYAKLLGEGKLPYA